MVLVVFIFASTTRQEFHTVPNKLMDSEHYKRLRWKTLIAFHSLSHFVFTTTKLSITPKLFRDWYFLFATSGTFIQM